MFRFNLRIMKWRFKTPLAIFLNFLLQFVVVNCQFHNQREGYATSFDFKKDLSVRHETAKELLNYMNKEANPCKDFFEFACGNWAQNHTPSNFGEVSTPQNELELHANLDLQALLSEPGKQSTIDERKVLNFYESCISVESTSLAQQGFMVNFIRQLGGIPSMPNTNWHNNYDWLHTAAELRGRYGLDILIGFEKSTNVETMREEAIYLGEPKITIIPVENCSAIAMKNIEIGANGFDALEAQIAENLQRWLSMSEPNAKRFAGEIVFFEMKLCEKMHLEPPLEEEEENNEFFRNSRRNPINNMGQNRLSGKRVVGDLVRFGLSQLNQFDNTINLARYVTQVLNTPYNEQIFIRSEQYLKHMSHVVRTSEKATVANYLMYNALAALNFPSDDRPKNRRFYCVKQVQKYFPKIIGALYSRRSQRNDLAQQVVEYFTEITKTLDESLDAEWITEQTRRSARQKLLQFKSRFPVYHNLDLNDLQIEQLNYWQKLVTVMQYNARKRNLPTDTIESFDARTKLMPLENEVLVGWALLQQPLYNNYYPRAMKYAALGHRLARELAMAFDEQGWRPSPLSNQLLDEYTAEGLKNQTECYRTQYSNYLYNNPEEFRNSSRLREIIADSNGLNLAFKAYLNWLKTIHPKQERGILKRETLPTVDFTNTQLFFIHFAQTRCAAKNGAEPPPEILPLESHTPERYDVNGPLSNFVEFAREFGCSIGTEMNPDDKCVIY